jgi:hypothetical protein
VYLSRNGPHQATREISLWSRSSCFSPVSHTRIISSHLQLGKGFRKATEQHGRQWVGWSLPHRSPPNRVQKHTGPQCKHTIKLSQTPLSCFGKHSKSVNCIVQADCQDLFSQSLQCQCSLPDARIQCLCYYVALADPPCAEVDWAARPVIIMI